MIRNVFFITLLITTIFFIQNSIADALFESAKVTTKYLDTDGTIVKKVFVYRNMSTFDQHHFGHVIDLKVQTKEIPTIYEGSFKSMPVLKELRLSACGIGSIEVGAFKNLPKLGSIHAKDNHIEVIEVGVFNHLTIHSLYLQRNRIHTIRDAAFDHLPNLHTLKLNSNRIAAWNSNWFKNTPQLTNILMRRNWLTKIPPRAFANLRGSHQVEQGQYLYDTTIFLSKNSIGEIDARAFEGIDGLNGLWLDRNKIEELPAGVFADLVELNELHLERNKLRELRGGDRMFAKLEEIETLVLSRNRLECVPYDVAKIVSVLNISDNPLDCNCVENLRERLSEEGSDIKIDDDGECLD